MKALILCGGFARRLEPIGEFIPKALLTLNGVPLIEYIMKDLENNGQIDEIIISTNRRFANQFEYWLKLKKGAGYRKEVRLVIEPSTNEKNKFGAVKGIAYDIEKAGIKDDLIIIAGDNFFTFNLSGLINRFSKLDKPAIIAYNLGSKEKAKRFGVVRLAKDGTIKEFEEKPEKPKSTLISTGIYFMPVQYLGKVKEYTSSVENADDIGNFIKWLNAETRVRAIVPASGEWFDIGTLDGYREIFMKQNGLDKKKRDKN